MVNFLCHGESKSSVFCFEHILESLESAGMADIQPTFADISMESADVGRKSAESRLTSAGKKSR